MDFATHLELTSQLLLHHEGSMKEENFRDTWKFLKLKKLKESLRTDN